MKEKIFYFVLLLMFSSCFNEKNKQVCQENNQTNIDSVMVIADSMFNLKKFNLSLELYSFILRNDSCNCKSLLRKGICEFNIKNYHSSNESFCLLLNMDCPKISKEQIFYYTGLNFYYQEDYYEAMAMFNKAIEYDSLQYKFYFASGICRLFLGDTLSSINDLENAVILGDTTQFTINELKNLKKNHD